MIVITACSEFLEVGGIVYFVGCTFINTATFVYFNVSAPDAAASICKDTIFNHNVNGVLPGTYLNNQKNWNVSYPAWNANKTAWDTAVIASGIATPPQPGNSPYTTP
jgi:hypothetical protein